MPTSCVWVEPELFLTHNGVKVFHTYRNDDANQGVRTFSFTTNSSSDDEHFDVRDLNVPGKGMLTNTPPFLSANANPDFQSASEEQKAIWQGQWNEWLRWGGDLDTAILSVLKEAIDLGLIVSAQVDEDVDQSGALPAGGSVGQNTCTNCASQVEGIVGCPGGAEVCQQCFDAGAN